MGLNFHCAQKRGYTGITQNRWLKTPKWSTEIALLAYLILSQLAEMPNWFSLLEPTVTLSIPPTQTAAVGPGDWQEWLPSLLASPSLRRVTGKWVLLTALLFIYSLKCLVTFVGYCRSHTVWVLEIHQWIEINEMLNLIRTNWKEKTKPSSFPLPLHSHCSKALTCPFSEALHLTLVTAFRYRLFKLQPS